MEKEVRRKFQRELDSRLSQVTDKREEGVEKVWQGFRDTLKDVAEKVLGKSRKRRHEKGNKLVERRGEDSREKEGLRIKSEGAWKEYKRASKEAKRIVREAKEEDWLRSGKELQKSFLANRRAFWKKIKAKEEEHRLKLGIESKDGTLLTQNVEV